MIVTTTDEIVGRRIERALGLATGAVTRSPGLARGLVATVKNFFGGELHEFTRTLAQAREQALDRMKEHARSLGADAVVGVRFASAEITSYAAEILCYGTAVRLAPQDDESDGAFTR